MRREWVGRGWAARDETAVEKEADICVRFPNLPAAG